MPVILAAGVVVLLGIVAGALYFSHRASNDSDAALHAMQLNLRVVRLFSALQDAETGQRGYLLTGDESYLEPFERAFTAVVAGYRGLEPELIGLGLPASRVDDLKRQADMKFQELRETIELRRKGDAVQALQLVRTGAGKTFMDEIRVIMSEVEALGVTNSTGRIASLRAVTSWLSMFIAGSAVLLVVIVGAALKLIFDHSRELDQARLALAASNESLEEKVAARTEGLQRVNNEVQSYAYIVGHDLRAPLVNIMGFTEELDRAAHVFANYLARPPGDRDDADEAAVRLAVDEDIPEALGFIRSSTKRMDRLINQILTLARAGNRNLQSERVDLSEVVKEALDSLRHQMLEKEIDAEISGHLPEVHSDRLALQQIIGNLLDNAVKYSEPTRPGRIRVSGRRYGRMVSLEVTDNGRGIAGSDHERIFELFRRSGQQNQPGDGVGLAHVRALTRRLGGDVKVRSVLGEGTTFQLTLSADLRHNNGSNTA